MSITLELKFEQMPRNWVGFPIRFSILDEQLERVSDGSLRMQSEGDKKILTVRSERELPEGKYVFALNLPSGETIAKSFDLRQDEMPKVVVPYTKSPHEWLESQTLLGHSFSMKEKFLTMEKLITTKKVDLTANPDGLQVPLKLSIYEQQFSDQSVLLYKTNLMRVAKEEKDELHSVFEFRGENYDQTAIAQIEVKKSFAYVMLPPLARFDDNEFLTLDCVWNDNVDTIRDTSFAVNMQNKDAQAMLSYMKLGDIVSAQKVSGAIVEQAHELIREKMQDIGAACAGGYLLTLTSNWKHLPPEWCQNLSDFFPHVADGAIINAHRSIIDLPEESSTANLEKIAELLINASTRGLPIFSAGLRLLNDDLLALLNTIQETQISQESAKKVHASHKRIQKFLRHCDFKNSFTTLVFDSPKEQKALFTNQ